MLFGATESEITKQAEDIFARKFITIDVRPEQKSTVANYFLQIDNAHKIDFIQRLMRLDGFKGILFFDSNQTMMRFAGILAHTKTKFGILANDFGKQNRAATLNDFKVGRIKLLLATDLAARGLDIPGVTYVVNYDIPSEFNTYMHRAGRTGRMGAKGFVVSIGDDHDFRDLKKLLARSVKIERVYFAGFHLSTKMPRKKENKKRDVNEQKQNAAPKEKHKKRKNKNKGYHPHYLKRKE